MVHMEKKSIAIYYLEADAVLLALCGRVRVVTTKHQTVAGEATVLERNCVSLKRGMMGTDLCGGHDRIVSARFSRDGGTKPVEGVVPFLLHSQHRGGQAHGWGRKTFVRRDESLIFFPMGLVDSTSQDFKISLSYCSKKIICEPRQKKKMKKCKMLCNQSSQPIILYFLLSFVLNLLQGATFSKILNTPILFFCFWWMVYSW